MAHRFLALGLNDLKNIRRDSLLLGVISVPWLMVLSTRLLIPSLTRWFQDTHSFELSPYYDLILGLLFLVNIPLLLGAVVGFLLLDERDSDTLTALRVTPLSLQDYAGYRFLTASCISCCYVMIGIPATGLFPLERLLAMVPITLISSLLTPLVGLLLVAIANNKVEGLAVAKVLGVFVIGPGAGYFMASSWQWLLGIIPTYWTVKAFILLFQGQAYWLEGLISMIYQSILSIGLLLYAGRKLK